MQNYLEASLKSVNIAQTKYKNTPLQKPWPEYEKAKEEERIAWNNFYISLKEIA